MSVTGAHSRPHCVPGHIAPTAPMIGMVQKHRNYKNDVVKKNVSQQKHSYASAEIHSRKSSDFRGWISANGFLSVTEYFLFIHLHIIIIIK